MNKKPSPPKLPLRFFRWFCYQEYQEDIEGDLLERFQRKAEDKGPRAARMGFAKDVLLLFRPGIIRSIEVNYQLNNIGMLKNFLKTGWRNFVKYSTNSAINVIGLSIGISATILLYLIIDYERSFDKFHQEHQSIYRVADKYPDGNYSDMIVTPLLPTLLDEYTEIISGTRFLEWEDLFIYGEKGFYFTFHIVDPGFSTVFSFESIYGDLKQGLATPGNIVLTKTISHKLFGDKNPVGEVLKMNEMEKELVVAAVINDPPKNTIIQFESLMSWPASPNQLDADQMGNWYNTFMTAYVKLSENASSEALEEKTTDFTTKYYLPKRKDHKVTFLSLANEHSRQTENDATVHILAIIAMAILVISCINFMNLSISQSLTRSKEIGIRKVMGSLKRQLTVQFLIEGLLTTLMALILAMVFVYALSPLVNDYYDLDIRFNILKNTSSIIFILGMSLLIGTLSSLMASVLLSNMKVIKSLKEKVSWSGKGQWLQKGLILFQFGISIVFVAGTLVIWKQLDFMKSYNLKFDADNVVSINSYSEHFKDADKAQKQLQLLRIELPRETAVSGVSLSQSVPGKYWDNYNYFATLDSAGTDGTHLKQITIDHRYFDVFGIKILQGRNFSDLIASDKETVIINQSAMKKLGWQDLDNKFLQPGGDGDKLPVVGLVEDYHYRSLKQSIEPVIHFYNPEVSNKLVVKLNPNLIPEGLEILEKSWASLNPYLPFDYSFIDQEFDLVYKSQERLGITATIFSNIAVLLALLGLFSITTFMVKKRKKEIGVRKVLGATLANIILLLSKGYAILILVAVVIATPIIYFVADKFLSDFTYRIPISPSVFIIALLTVLLSAMAVVSLQSGRAATENPVNSLKNE